MWRGLQAHSFLSSTAWKAYAELVTNSMLSYNWQVARVTSDEPGNKWLLYKSPSVWVSYIQETLCFPQKEFTRGHKTLQGAVFYWTQQPSWHTPSCQLHATCHDAKPESRASREQLGCQVAQTLLSFLLASPSAPPPPQTALTR